MVNKPNRKHRRQRQIRELIRIGKNVRVRLYDERHECKNFTSGFIMYYSKVDKHHLFQGYYCRSNCKEMFIPLNMITHVYAPCDENYDGGRIILSTTRLMERVK